MKIFKGLVTIPIAFIVFLLVAGSAGAAESPPPAFLPGLLQTDTTPNGCISCHQKVGDKDFTIPAELRNIKGHPDISKSIKTVPDDCRACHRDGAKLPSIAKVVHLQHFGPDATKNAFVQRYAGSCLNCHKLDLSTGTMSIKSGKANW